MSCRLRTMLRCLSSSKNRAALLDSSVYHFLPERSHALGCDPMTERVNLGMAGGWSTMALVFKTVAYQL